MMHDANVLAIESLATTIENLASRIAETDPFDDHYWLQMHKLRTFEAEFETLCREATVRLDRWYAAREKFLAIGESPSNDLKSSD